MDYTTTSKFLLRPLGIIEKEEKLENSKIKDFGFINAFVKDLNHETEYSHPLYLLFKQAHAIVHFQDFVLGEYERGLLLEDYDYPEGFVVLVYDYPEECKSDYEKILAGKYSETSKYFQSFFVEKSVYKGKSTDSYYHRIFNKDPEVRKAMERAYEVEIDEDSEVRSIPNIENETLDISKYINE